VALYHFGNGNIRGARKLHGSVHGYLDAYAPRHLGLDVTAFLACRDANQKLLSGHGSDETILVQLLVKIVSPAGGQTRKAAR
jgi:predicted metal-dependent hydrolase